MGFQLLPTHTFRDSMRPSLTLDVTLISPAIPKPLMGLKPFLGVVTPPKSLSPFLCPIAVPRMSQRTPILGNIHHLGQSCSHYVFSPSFFLLLKSVDSWSPLGSTGGGSASIKEPKAGKPIKTFHYRPDNFMISKTREERTSNASFVHFLKRTTVSPRFCQH